MGSVKNLGILEPAFENKFGDGRFFFSERYSIFDWGKMPDEIKKKGASLAIMGAFNFEELEKRNIKTHYIGLETELSIAANIMKLEENKILSFSDSGEDCIPNVMRIKMAKVYKPVAREFFKDGNPIAEYDYSFFNVNRGNINNYLVGLEIIFRNGLPLGSSVFKRIKKAKEIENPEEREKTLKGIYGKLGLSSEPKPGDMLPKPVLGYTTKLEEGDRHLTEDEAYKISGLREEEFAKIAPLALRVNDFITEQAEKTGLKPHWDGKVEMAYFNGLFIVDVVGTFDEDRMGNLVSKEFLRQWYIKNQPEFPKACDEWKKTGEGWQGRCPVRPIKLPAELSTLVSQMYQSGCNQYVQKKIFDVPPLGEVMKKLEKYK